MEEKLWEQIPVKIKSKYTNSHTRKLTEDVVCEMAIILSRSQLERSQYSCMNTEYLLSFHCNEVEAGNLWSQLNQYWQPPQLAPAI